MIEQSFLSNVMLSALPFFCVLALWCFRYLEQRLPGKLQTTLHEFVAQAVAMVEQMHGNATPLQKKNLAIQATIDLFRAFHLPIPPVSALSTAIEATVYAVHQASQYAPTQALPVVRVQGQAQRVDMANTIRVPAVKPPTQLTPMTGQQG
jgi:hypothetical protein